MRLEDLKFCKICMGILFVDEPTLTIPDTDNDGEIVVYAKVCSACETIHFIQDGNLAYQFYPTKEDFTFVPMVSDMEIKTK